MCAALESTNNLKMTANVLHQESSKAKANAALLTRQLEEVTEDRKQKVEDVESERDDLSAKLHDAEARAKRSEDTISDLTSMNDFLREAIVIVGEQQGHLIAEIDVLKQKNSSLNT